MAHGCYSGGFAFDEDDDAPLRKPQGARKTKPAAASAAPAVPPSLPASSARSPTTSGPPKLLYISSTRLAELSRGLPVNQDRPALVHSLVRAYRLLEGAASEEAQPASPAQLCGFHSREYAAALACWERLTEGQRAAFGLEDDCAPFPGLYELAALTAGGSLQAAAGLCSRRYSLAVHLDGGRHHAHKSRAAGFCYTNDVVLAILQLLGSFRRILYIDLDIHHGDAVEEAFFHTHRVLTLSFHKHAPGFFPGTGAGGSSGATGAGSGRGFALNLPLGDGLRDGLLVAAFGELAAGAAAAYRPDCVVLQCGVDGLAHDPLAASWALTPAAYAACACQAASWGLPLLVLGGGGYDSPTAAATWAGVLAALLGRQLADDVPEHEHFERYGPGFTLSSVTKRLLPPDTNNAAAVLAECRRLVAELREAVARTEGRGSSNSNSSHGGSSVIVASSHGGSSQIVASSHGRSSQIGVSSQAAAAAGAGVVAAAAVGAGAQQRRARVC